MATRKRTARTTSAAKKSAKRTAKTASKSAAKKATKKAATKRTPDKRTPAKLVDRNARKKLVRYRQKRDFTKTAEPSGDRPPAKRRALRFVIQKHDASHLHYDWRLELDGVMKSWAVPKGPSMIPGVRRLAMEVEDHPISYNTFEGTIPKGEYGGGTVMLWDRGTYEPTGGGGADALREGYAKGKLDVTLHGERLQGAFTLVRTRGSGERAQWLLIKRTDEHARRGHELTDEMTTSVDSGRTMDEIAVGDRVWRSNRSK